MFERVSGVLCVVCVQPQAHVVCTSLFVTKLKSEKVCKSSFFYPRDCRYGFLPVTGAADSHSDAVWALRGGSRFTALRGASTAFRGSPLAPDTTAERPTRSGVRSLTQSL